MFCVYQISLIRMNFFYTRRLFIRAGATRRRFSKAKNSFLYKYETLGKLYNSTATAEKSHFYCNSLFIEFLGCVDIVPVLSNVSLDRRSLCRAAKFKRNQLVVNLKQTEKPSSKNRTPVGRRHRRQLYTYTAYR